jgi:hypothetical protein
LISALFRADVGADFADDINRVAVVVVVEKAYMLELPYHIDGGKGRLHGLLRRIAATAT